MASMSIPLNKIFLGIVLLDNTCSAVIIFYDWKRSEVYRGRRSPRNKRKV